MRIKIILSGTIEYFRIQNVVFDVRQLLMVLVFLCEFRTGESFYRRMRIQIQSSQRSLNVRMNQFIT